MASESAAGRGSIAYEPCPHDGHSHDWRDCPTPEEWATTTAATEKAAYSPVPKVGDRVRVTFEAEVLAVEQASGNRGIANFRTRAGAGMNDCVWLVREPGFGEIISVELVGDEQPATSTTGRSDHG